MPKRLPPIPAAPSVRRGRRLPAFLARRRDDEGLPNPDGVLTAYMALRMMAPTLSDAEAWARAYDAARAIHERKTEHVSYEESTA